MRFFVCIVVLTQLVGMVADAFILTNIDNSASNYRTVLAPVTQLQSKTDDNNNVQVGDNEEQQVNHRHNYFDRRKFIYTTSLLLSGATIQPVLAASSSSLSPSKQEEIDKINIVKGYDRLQYLLSNWEMETTICGMGGDKLERSCDRTPMKVMEYMGYKSTTDPLYKAEKTLRRLYENTNVPAKRDAEFLEAVEVSWGYSDDQCTYSPIE